MRNLILLVVLALAAPMMASAVELGAADLYGVKEKNLSRLLDDSASSDSVSAPAAAGQFQFHVAPVAYWSFDEDLNALIDKPVWGADIGFLFWTGPQLGVGISGQHMSAGGEGKINGIKFTQVEFTYTNVYVDFRGRMFDIDGFRMYGATGLGYSKLRLKAEAVSWFFFGDIDETDDGFAYYAAFGFEGPWVFSEFRYTESSFDDDDETATALTGLQFLIGMRTP